MRPQRLHILPARKKEIRDLIQLLLDRILPPLPITRNRLLGLIRMPPLLARNRHRRLPPRAHVHAPAAAARKRPDLDAPGKPVREARLGGEQRTEAQLQRRELRARCAAERGHLPVAVVIRERVVLCQLCFVLGLERCFGGGSGSGAGAGAGRERDGGCGGGAEVESIECLEDAFDVAHDVEVHDCAPGRAFLVERGGRVEQLELLLQC